MSRVKEQSRGAEQGSIAEEQSRGTHQRWMAEEQRPSGAGQTNSSRSRGDFGVAARTRSLATSRGTRATKAASLSPAQRLVADPPSLANLIQWTAFS